MIPAIILAGGFGTRLQSEISDIPKPMAPIQSIPFLVYILEYLESSGITEVILAVGYKKEAIIDFFGDRFQHIKLSYSVEEEPLGTGGAILKAFDFVEGNQAFVINGDTYFQPDLKSLTKVHSKGNAQCTLALTRVYHQDRYGSVIIENDNQVIGFEEKKFREDSLINGGIYLINRNLFQGFKSGETFSFEKDLMEKDCGARSIYGFVSDKIFIDIGIPKDYNLAQRILPVLNGKDKSWSLFLDRDGVINEKRDNDYVKDWNEFEFIPGAIDAIATFTRFYNHIFVVTNQQGVGKHLMTEVELLSIHQQMVEQIEEKGGKVDQIYYCTDLNSKTKNCRKPSPAMAYQASLDYPDIQFTNSMMVGDSISDIEFGENLNMVTVLVNPKSDVYEKTEPNFYTKSLDSLASNFQVAENLSPVYRNN